MFITATLRVPQDVNRLKLLSEIYPGDNRVHLIPFFSSDTVWALVPYESVWKGLMAIYNSEKFVVGIPRLSSGIPNKSVASLSIAYTSLAKSLKEYNAASEGSDTAKVVQCSRDHCQ
jgi:hypothetical protein